MLTMNWVVMMTQPLRMYHDHWIPHQNSFSQQKNIITQNRGNVCVCVCVSSLGCTHDETEESMNEMSRRECVT